MNDSKAGSAVTRWLERAPDAVFATYAMLAAFGTYFCMYAFRKPFSAGTYEGLQFFGWEIELKTAFVISQIIGYTLSKFIGIKVLSEHVSGNRGKWLVALILFAEASLLLFAVLPPNFKVVALFLNGLPLGMIWGLCVAYLEGRRTAELLLAGLSCSFIVSSGAVKDVGLWLMSSGVPEFWMPVATGALFLPAFLLFVFLLNQIPKPTTADIVARSERKDMSGSDRMAFLKRFAPGMSLMILGYVLLTAYRDFRDNYGKEIFDALGYGEEPGIFTRTELPVAFFVMIALAVLTLVKDNKRGVAAAFILTIIGAAILGVGTLLFEQGTIDGATWMILTGLGSYLAYVPFGSALFERIMAYTRFAGTAVFAIYVADAAGYTGSIATMLFKDIFAGGTSRLAFFTTFTYLMAIVGIALQFAAMIFFLRQKPETAALPDATAPGTPST